MTVRVDGLARLRRTLAAAGRDLQAMPAAHARAARSAATEAASRAPRRTGRLASALCPVSSLTDGGVRTLVPYAEPINYGWPSRGIPAHPFLAPALTSAEPDILDAFHSAANAALRKVHGT